MLIRRMERFNKIKVNVYGDDSPTVMLLYYDGIISNAFPKSGEVVPLHSIVSQTSNNKH